MSSVGLIFDVAPCAALQGYLYWCERTSEIPLNIHMSDWGIRIDIGICTVYTLAVVLFLLSWFMQEFVILIVAAAMTLAAMVVDIVDRLLRPKKS